MFFDVFVYCLAFDIEPSRLAVFFDALYHEAMIGDFVGDGEHGVLTSAMDLERDANPGIFLFIWIGVETEATSGVYQGLNRRIF